MTRIAFFGTPDFAVPSLRALAGEGFDVVCVVTQPDRPRGRSRTTLVPTPIKRVALEEELPVLQPDRPIEARFLEEFHSYGPDLGVVVAYGHILRPELLAIPTHGMVNVHASLLPKLRGAAPIQAALLSGIETTGVTIMEMEEGLDSGPVLHQVPTPIEPDETGGELTVRLSELGALALIEYLALRGEGVVQPRVQDDTQATFAPKIKREDCRIDWDKDALSIARAVRAFDPAPGAWTTFEKGMIKLFGASHGPETGAPGEILETEPALIVGTDIGALHIRDAQPEGRGRMTAEAWGRGRADAKGQRFE